MFCRHVYITFYCFIPKDMYNSQTRKHVKLISICLLILILSACNSPSKNKVTSVPLSDKVFSLGSTLEMLQDTTITFAQVQEVFTPFINQLWKESGDLQDLNKRLSAQKESLVYIDALTEWFDTQLGQGRDVSAKSFNEILDPLTIIGSQWFCDPDDEYPYIWRELYYVSNRKSEKPIDGYFKIMVILPDEDNPAPSAHIFFPMSAEGAPRLFFSYYSDRSIGEEDYLQQVIVDFDDKHWNPRHGEIPMAAFGGKDIVEKMLQYDVMYLAFRSSPTQTGGSGETEIAMMPLNSFHLAYGAISEEY